ncbi:MAG: hypothetical protein VYE46_08940 [Cyanobacteriota bacterium]|nr:hypothetical protein [Cyanobacteriota bacterium]
MKPLGISFWVGDGDLPSSTRPTTCEAPWLVPWRALPAAHYALQLLLGWRGHTADIQHSSVVFWCDGSGVIPCFPEVPSVDGGGEDAQRMRSRSAVADCFPGCK